MIVHHHPFLAASRFVRLILAEHAIEAEYVVEPFWEARPDFVAANPALTLPVAWDGGAAPLVGPGVIMEYVDERYGALRAGQRLMPADPFARAEVRRLVEWFLHKFEEEVTGPLVGERVLKIEMPSRRGGGSPDTALLRAARQNVVGHVHYLGSLAATRNWLAGDQLTFADFAAGATLSLVGYLGEVPWQADPAVKQWYQRLKSRPAFRPLLTDKAKLVMPSRHYADLDF